MTKLRSIILLTVLMVSVNIIHAINDMPIIAAFQGEHHNSSYGYSMVSLDFNHDGNDDLVVCSYSFGYEYGESPSKGKVYIYYGGSGFSNNTQPSIMLEGNVVGSNGRRIWAIFKVGDVSGDGFDDLCIHVEDYGDSDKLLLFYGGTPNLDNPDHVINLSEIFFHSFTLFPLGGILTEII